MFTVYYFEGPGYEIFPLRTRFNDIFHQWGGGRYWLGNILHALRGPQDIWHDGYVRGDIRPADCHQLRNGKWAMRVEVTDGDCRGLWELMIRKWVPHCRYYYLVYGENDADAETNDLKQKYFCGDYAVFAKLSDMTPEKLRRVLSQHTVHFRRADKTNDFYDYDVHYSYWQKEDLRQQLLNLMPCPELSADELIDLVRSKLRGSGIRLCFETRVRIYRIHYLVRDGQQYFMPALEALRKEGQIH